MRNRTNGFAVIEIAVISAVVLITLSAIILYTLSSKAQPSNESSASPTPTVAIINDSPTPVNQSNSITPTIVTPTSANPTTQASATPTKKSASTTPAPTATPTNSPTATPTVSQPTATPIPPTPANAANTSCGSSYTFFDTSPVDMSQFYNIVPLGNLNPSGHVFPTDHIYFYQNVFSTATLVAPGNATIIRISASENQTAGTIDYSIYFKPCSQLEAYFLHVNTISDKLAAAFTAPFSWDNSYSTGGSTYHNYGRNVSVNVSSGEEIGTFTATNSHPSFDMGAYDSRVTLNFINPNARTQSTHTVCPIDYFSPSLISNLYSYFMSGSGIKRTISPICGTIDQDVTGTAQGIWLLAGTTSVSGEDPHLALVHDNLDPGKAVFSVGTSVSGSGLNSGVYQFTPESGSGVNKDFNQITPGAVECFQISYPTVSILVQLTSSTTLKIEKSTSPTCGTGPWSFSGNETSFQR